MRGGKEEKYEGERRERGSMRERGERERKYDGERKRIRVGKRESKYGREGREERGGESELVIAGQRRNECLFTFLLFKHPTGANIKGLPTNKHGPETFIFKQTSLYSNKSKMKMITTLFVSRNPS